MVGNGSVTLQAAVSDSSVTGSGSLLSVVFTAYADGHPHDIFPSNASMTVDTPSGTTAELPLSQADLQKAASKYGSGGEVSITWTARATVEGSKGPDSPPSHLASCTFTFDDATPSAPSLWDNSGYTTACRPAADLLDGCRD